MLTLYYRLAQRLYRFRVVLWILGVTSAALFGGALFLSDGTIDAGRWAAVDLPPRTRGFFFQGAARQQE